MLRRNPPTRSACDNCHDLKTRCSRDGISVDCQRCLRLELNCCYSASRRMGRPKRNGRRHQDEPRMHASPDPLSQGHRLSAAASSSIGNSQRSQLRCADVLAPSVASFDEYLTTRRFIDSLDAGELAVRPDPGTFNSQGDGPNIDADVFFLDASPFASDNLGGIISFSNDTSTAASPGSSSTKEQASPRCGLKIHHELVGDNLAFPRPSDGADSDAPKQEHIGVAHDHNVLGREGGPTPLANEPDGSGRSPLHRLSALQQDLHRLLAAIHTAENGEGTNENTRLRPSPGMRLDEIFAVTEVFADILSNLYSSGHRHPAAPQCPGISPLSTTPGIDSIQGCVRPDMATLLVVLACYLWLLNIYTALLIRSRESSVATGHSQEAFRSTHHPLPVISIGSFNLLGLPELNVSINLHLISEMFSRVQSMAILCFQQTISYHDDAGLRGPHAFDGEGSRLASPMLSLAEIAMKQIQMKERHVSAILQNISENLHLRKCLGLNSGIHQHTFP